MKQTIVNSLLAAATALALVSCSGGSSAAPGSISNPFPTTNSAPQTTGAAVINKIVGIGDSLTAGEESNGLIGSPLAGNVNPLFPGTSPQPLLPPSQPYGWWADMYNAAHGGVSPNAAGAANSVLPLINSPGIGGFLVLATAGGFTGVQGSCAGLNAAAFNPATALSGTRVSPNAIPWDLGVPGQMVHEALYQTGPQGSCQNVSVAPGSLFQAETTAFLPILGNFNGLSQVQAARSLNPTLTTVWLGANDLLKYALSGGAFGPTPTASIQSDLMTIVQTMQQVGSQVAIANLPDVLKTPLFIAIPNVPVQNTDPLPLTIVAITAGAVPIGTATALANGVVGANSLTAGSYVTVAALPAILAVLPPTNAAIPNNLVALGEALPTALATNVQAMNTAYNTAIAQVASSTNAAFVDVHQLFVTAATSGVPVNPPTCCALTLNGGLVSWDQLHPSYTGYAVIANAWITAINSKFGTSIPQVNVANAYAADPYAPGSPSFGVSKIRAPGR